MAIQHVSAERLAELFHHYHQALGPGFGCRSDHTEQSWKDIPEEQRHRMTAAVRLMLLELDLLEHRQDIRNYFVKPGEAEWGC